MKRYLYIIIMMCCIPMVQAQTLKDQRVADGSEMYKLEELVEQFCSYVEKLGGTHSVSKAEKNEIRHNLVKKLFINYEERQMITTYGSGNKKHTKMHEYMYRLQQQAGNPKKQGRHVDITYDLDFQFATNDGQLIWKYEGVTKEGIRKYSTTVMIYQTYMKETKNGVEVIRMRREVDKKEMKAYKFVLPDGKTELIKLYDITRAERLDTKY